MDLTASLCVYLITHIHTVAILLGHLKLPFDKIKEAVLKCDESVLSEQHLRQLEAFAPDKTEVILKLAL